MQKLLAGVPLEPEDNETEMSAKEIEDSLQGIQTKLEKDLESKESKVKK